MIVKGEGTVSVWNCGLFRRWAKRGIPAFWLGLWIASRQLGGLGRWRL